MFTLNLNELLLLVPWAVCSSATGEPMRSEPTCYNNLFHLAGHIAHETIQVVLQFKHARKEVFEETAF